MRAGTRRSLIDIEMPVQVRSSTGMMTTTWELFKRMWASIETMRVYEKSAAQSSYPGADTTIGIKYVAGLLPTMRIVYNNKIYSILGINDIDERHRDVEFTCQSGAKAQ